MDWTETKPALLRKLFRWGGFTTEAALLRFYEATITACGKIRRKGDWDWKHSQADVVTVAGTLGPYPAPAAFYRMAQDRKVYLYGYQDYQGQIMAPILETATDRWDVIFRVTDEMLYFRADPGTGTVQFNFIPTLTSTPTDANAQANVELMPGNLFDVLADFIEADFLAESPDTKVDGIAKLNEATLNLEKEWDEFQKGRPRQRQRSPRGMDGRPFDGMGQQVNLSRSSRGRYPRGQGFR